MPDIIHIQNLKIDACVGVPDAERAQPQTLHVCLTLEPNVNFAGLDDRIENAVDYAIVCAEIKAVTSERPRSLLETLAEEIAQRLLSRFPIWKLTLELRKFALPETDYVAVRIDRPL